MGPRLAAFVAGVILVILVGSLTAILLNRGDAGQTQTTPASALVTSTTTTLATTTGKDGGAILPLEFTDPRTGDSEIVLFDVEGNRLEAEDFDEVLETSEELTCVRRENKMGYLDLTGAIAIDLHFDAVWVEHNAGAAWYVHPSNPSFSEGLAGVSVEGKIGFIDRNANMVIPPAYEDTYGFSESLAAVKMDGKWGFIDATGRLIIPCRYVEVMSFSGGLAAFSYEHQDYRRYAIHQAGFINQRGEEVIPPSFISVESFSEGLAVVNVNSKYGYIDQTGKMVIEPRWAWAWSFSEGRAPVMTGDRWGFIDKDGELAIDLDFEGVNHFSEGLAGVRWLGDKGVAYIDRDGREVISGLIGDEFRHGLARVTTDDGEAYIDNMGNIVIKGWLSDEGGDTAYERMSQNLVALLKALDERMPKLLNEIQHAELPILLLDDLDLELVRIETQLDLARERLSRIAPPSGHAGPQSVLMQAADAMVDCIQMTSRGRCQAWEANDNRAGSSDFGHAAALCDDSRSALQAYEQSRPIATLGSSTDLFRQLLNAVDKDTGLACQLNDFQVSGDWAGAAVSPAIAAVHLGVCLLHREEGDWAVAHWGSSGSSKESTEGWQQHGAPADIASFLVTAAGPANPGPSEKSLAWAASLNGAYWMDETLYFVVGAAARSEKEAQDLHGGGVLVGGVASLDVV